MTLRIASRALVALICICLLPQANAETARLGRPMLPAMPDLARWTGILEAITHPPRARGRVSIQTADQEPALRARFLHVARKMPAWTGEAVVVHEGNYALEDVAAAVTRPDLLRCQAGTCELRAPLLVKRNAGLIIMGQADRPLRLRMVQEAGAFMVNVGRLHLQHAMVVGWNTTVPAPAETAGTTFRPFVVAFGAAETFVLRSELRHLGFEMSKSFGFTLSSKEDLYPGEQPTARIYASRFHELFYGFYSFEARGAVLIGNQFSDCHRYGIDPHDASWDLLIARNEIYGTRGHGLILSKHVHSSWIVENHSHDNLGSGLLLDASSNNNVVAGNRLIDNRRDGIAIYESHDNLVALNEVRRNGAVGIRVRAGENNAIANNTIAGNLEHGLRVYDWPDNKRPMPAKYAAHRRPVTLRLSGNSFAENGLGACQFKTVREIVAFADDAGVLEPCGRPRSNLEEASSGGVWPRVRGPSDAVRLIRDEEIQDGSADDTLQRQRSR